MMRIGLLVSDSVSPFLCSFDSIRPNLSNFCRSCCSHEKPTQPIRYAANAVFSTITIRRKPFFIQITYDSQIDSVLPIVRRWRNAKALHLVKQGGALQA